MPPPPPPPSVLFRLTGPHGRLVGVSIPAPAGPLPPLEEQAFAAALAAARQPSFTAGRLALRLALADLGLPIDLPLLPDQRGAPTLPAGSVGSISHKRGCAVGLAAPADGNQRGVDLEELRPLRMNIAPRVLTAGERAQLDQVPPEGRDRFVLERFSLKEAFYKAVNAFVGTSVSFHAVQITEIRSDGSVVWTAPLLDQHGLHAQGWITDVSGHLLTTALVGPTRL
jgi:4'-phosphopantetheinyl transferase EntD